MPATKLLVASIVAAGCRDFMVGPFVFYKYGASCCLQGWACLMCVCTAVRGLYEAG